MFEAEVRCTSEDGHAPVHAPRGPRRPQLRLVGPALLQWPDGRQQPLSSRDALLLGRLAQDGPQERQRLAAWLWPDTPAPQARTNLRQRLLRLRRALGLELLQGERRLMIDPDLPGDWRDPLAALRLDPAALPGDWLDPVAVGSRAADGEIDAWLLAAREHWRSRCHAALQACAEAAERRGQPAAALPYLQRLCREDPLHEGHHRRLMQVQLHCGERGAALTTYARLQQRLRAELALAPAPQTAALAQRAGTLAARCGVPPCFAGSTVPVHRLFEVLQSGSASLDDFLRRFPDVSRPAALAVLHTAQARWRTDACGG